jgi:hypothetical protein
MDKSNDNFDELYGANSVSSNIALSGNTVSTYVTNQDIVLGPDGTGTIRTASDLIPDVNNTRYIGNANIRPLGAYIGTAGVISSGPISLPTFANAAVRDSTITQPITGMIVNTANVFQSYNGTSWASPASAYGDSQVTTLLGTLGANVISGTGNITTTGNITGGNLLTGGDVVPDGNVTMGTGNITSQSGNIVTTSGNISGGNFITGGIVIATGNVSGGNVSGATVTATNNVTLPFFADDAARDAAITSPAAGMMIFNSTGTKFQGYTGSAWVDLN